MRAGWPPSTTVRSESGMAPLAEVEVFVAYHWRLVVQHRLGALGRGQAGEDLLDGRRLGAVRELAGDAGGVGDRPGDRRLLALGQQVLAGEPEGGDRQHERQQRGAEGEGEREAGPQAEASDGVERRACRRRSAGRRIGGRSGGQVLELVAEARAR